MGLAGVALRCLLQGRAFERLASNIYCRGGEQASPPRPPLNKKTTCTYFRHSVPLSFGCPPRAATGVVSLRWLKLGLSSRRCSASVAAARRRIGASPGVRRQCGMANAEGSSTSTAEPAAVAQQYDEDGYAIDNRPMPTQGSLHYWQRKIWVLLDDPASSAAVRAPLLTACQPAAPPRLAAIATAPPPGTSRRAACSMLLVDAGMPCATCVPRAPCTCQSCHGCRGCHVCHVCDACHLCDVCKACHLCHV